ncbi:MAG: hypothetical protein HZC28_16965 [Spirochaetes bacterium]|nr:hypothetical protein [Spirochaetota bacterium]
MKHIILIFSALVIVSVSCTRNRTNPYDPAAAYELKTNTLVSAAALSVTGIKFDEISFKWNRYDGEYFASYIIQRGASTSSLATIHTVTEANTTTYRDAGLNAGTVYTYRILATTKRGAVLTNEFSAMTSPRYIEMEYMRDDAALMNIGEIRNIVYFSENSTILENYFIADYFGSEPTEGYGYGKDNLWRLDRHDKVAHTGNSIQRLLQLSGVELYNGEMTKFNTIMREYDPSLITNTSVGGLGSLDSYNYINQGHLYGKEIINMLLVEQKDIDGYMTNNTLVLTYQYNSFGATIVTNCYISIPMIYRNGKSFDRTVSEKFAAYNADAVATNRQPTNLISFLKVSNGLSLRSATPTGISTIFPYGSIFTKNSASYYAFSMASGWQEIHRLQHTGNAEAQNFAFTSVQGINLNSGSFDVMSHVTTNASPALANFFYYTYRIKDYFFYASDNYFYLINRPLGIIVQYKLDGSFSRIIGLGGSRLGEFNYPYSLVVAYNKIFVADTGNFRVQIFKEDGTFLSTLGEQGLGEYGFSAPRNISVNLHGKKLRVTDKYKIKMFDITSLQ